MGDVAITIIADSSIALANQWRTVLSNYVSPMLSRLLENRSNDQPKINIVTYATADYRPTPILAKRYFNHPQGVLRELKEEPSTLGIGKTASGGKVGMAALEGYAAALEMFDLFLKSQSSARDTSSDKLAESHLIPICHIIHISSSRSDDARYPLWNQTTNLDNLSWKTLPEELRKRNISLSMILLGANDQLSEVHASTTTEPCQTWFQVQSSHTILLSSQSSWTPMSTKRVNENGDSDKADDAKRQRTSPLHQTLPLATSQPNSSQTTISNAAGNTASSSSLPIGQSNVALLQGGTQGFLQRFRAMGAQLGADQEKFESLRQQGRLQEAENLKKTIAPKLQMYNKLRLYVLKLTQQAAAAHAGESSNARDAKSEPKSEQLPPAATFPNQNQSAFLGISTDTSSHVPQSGLPQTMQQVVQSRRQNPQLLAGAASGADSGSRPSGNILPQFSPSVAAQYQRLVKREGIKGQAPLSSTQMAVGQTSGLAPSSNPPQIQAVPNENQTWVGTLSWKDPRTMMIMETSVHVLSRTNIRPDLWPAKLELELSTEHAVPLPVIREWMGRHGPAGCHIKPSSGTANPQENLRLFRSLAALLVEQNVYALGSWPLPTTGILKRTVLIFPFGSDADLVAAVSPETGIPEFPRAPVQATMGLRPNMTGPSGNVMTNVVAALQNMSPEDRQKLMTAQRIRQQEMLQARAAGIQTNNAGNANLLGNLMGGTWSGAQGTGNMSAQLPFNANQQAQMAASLGLTGNLGQNMQGFPGMQNGRNMNEALAILQQQLHQQQQRQAGMPGMPGPSNPGAAPF